MFGYIVINNKEMKPKEYEVYHSYYCGLCRELNEVCGLKGRLTLTYDMTFLVILLSGLYEPETKQEIKKCVFHPLQENETRTNLCTSYVADMNLLMAYYQCLDDWKGDKKIKRYAMHKLLSGYCKTTLREKYPEKLSHIESSMAELSQGGQAGTQNIDRMAGCFGSILGEIFAWKEDEWKESLQRIGFYLGKFIYLSDAYGEIESDTKRGSFNALMDLQGKEDFEKEFHKILTMMMAECCREFEKLPIIENVDIMRNILYSGVWSRYNMIKKERGI